MLESFRKRENPRDTTHNSNNPNNPNHSRLTNPGAPVPRAPAPEPQARVSEPANETGRYERLAARPAQPETSKSIETPAPAPDSQPGTRSTRESARLTVGPDIKLKGTEITDCDTLIVEGQVDACMDSRVIEIAENGIFHGKVHVDIAEVHGRFEGELTAHKQLMIRKSGKVAGKIRYGKLLIDEGGEISGDIAAADPAIAEVRAHAWVPAPIDHSLLNASESQRSPESAPPAAAATPPQRVPSTATQR